MRLYHRGTRLAGPRLSMPANRRYPAGVLSLIVGLLALLGVSLAPVPVVWADAAQQPILTAGAVVSLQGTPHLWIADDEETLHWVGDTRALAERQVNWEQRTEVTLSELQDLRRGDPWLSSGLLKDGALLYLVHWPSDDAVPRLLHIQSVADLELFGVSWRNYGALVYEPAAWEREFGLKVSSLNRAALPLVTGPILAWGEFGDTPGEFDNPRGIAVDAAGNVYVADYQNDRIQKLSTAGQPLAQWGMSGDGPGEFRGPRSIALDAQGNIYVADYWNHRVHKLSPTGQPLAQWGSYGQAPGQFDHPTAVAVDTHGNVYVAEYWAHRVQKLSSTGQPLAVWGSQGSDPGQLLWPRDLALDSAGNVYVADSGNNRIQKFTPSGRPLLQWEINTDPLDSQTEPVAPTAVATDAAGNVYVTSEKWLAKYSAEGQLLAQRQPARYGPGQFYRLTGVTVDAQGTLFVLDRGSSSVVQVPASALQPAGGG